MGNVTGGTICELIKGIIKIMKSDFVGFLLQNIVLIWLEKKVELANTAGRSLVIEAAISQGGRSE